MSQLVILFLSQIKQHEILAFLIHVYDQYLLISIHKQPPHILNTRSSFHLISE